MIRSVGLVGLGAIGTPLASALFGKFKENFFLIADAKHERKLKKQNVYINGLLFAPSIITD